MHDGDRGGDKGGGERGGRNRDDWNKWGKLSNWSKWGNRSDYGRYPDYGSGWSPQWSDYSRYPEAGGGAPPPEAARPPAPAASLDDPPSPPTVIGRRDVGNVRHAADTLRSRYRDFTESEIAHTTKTMMKQVSIRFTEAQL